MKDYYRLLGVNNNAHQAEIKRSYRRLAFQYHPDRNPSPEAEAYFKEINEAYEVIGDTVKRYDYDLRFQLKEEPTAYTSTQAKTHRDPRYRQRTTPNANYKSKNQEMFELYLHWDYKN